VTVIALSTIKAFLNRGVGVADAREPVMAWFRQVRQADWAKSAEIKRDIRSASILSDGRVVFNIAGNKYRIVARINYPYRVVCIRFVGTHGSTTPSTHRAFEVSAMEIAPIKSHRDYRRVLKEIEGLMSARRNSLEGDRLDVLVTLVEAWERKHYRLDLPDPVEAIRYHMEQSGLQPRDLIPFIGSRNRVHEVLNRRRELTLNMIRRLNEGLGIPAESLIKIGQNKAA
jgi:HTH-type transcriptional regulator/antitoxin HigA